MVTDSIRKKVLESSEITEFQRKVYLELFRAESSGKQASDLH